MKIALVIEKMDFYRGGREASTGQIALALADRGHDVTVLCRRGELDDERVTVRHVGRRRKPPWSWLTRLSRPATQRAFISDVSDAIAAERYDVVHAVCPLPGANVYQPRGGTVPAQAAASIRRRSLPGKLLAYAVEPLNGMRRLNGRLERQVAGDPSVMCLAVSEMVGEEFARFYDRTERVRVVYNAVDVPDVSDEQRAEWRQRRRFQLGLQQDDLLFVTIAKNFELKGVRETIAAFSRWVQADRGLRARLAVIGRDRVLTEGYQRHAGNCGVGSQVSFIDPSEDIFQWYAAADAVMLLSWYDPCSRVILEATRWGIPSITTIFNGAAEVTSGGAGIVVSSPAETRRVAEAMGELADPEARAARSAACLNVAGELGIDRHIDELLEVYAAAAAVREAQ